MIYTPMRYMPVGGTPIRGTLMRCTPMRYTSMRCTPIRGKLVTDDGRIGSGPFFIASQEGVAPGDEIYLAAGSRMPLLLRRAGPPSAERGDVAYALVGVCYVHGIMDGEGTATFGNFRSVYIT